MPISNVATTILICLLAFVQGSYSLKYSDVEDLGISCPDQHICEGIQDNSPDLERGCECDSACDAYGDCCIGAGRQRDRPSWTGEQTYRPSWTGEQTYRPSWTREHRYRPSWTGEQRYRPSWTGEQTYRPSWTREHRYRPSWTREQRYRPSWTGEQTYRPSWTGEQTYRPSWTGEQRYRPSWTGEQKYRPSWTREQTYRPSWTGEQRYRPSWIGEQKYRPSWTGEQQYRSSWTGEQQYRPAWTGGQPSIQAASTVAECSKYGDYDHPNIYIVSTCNKNWNGPIEVKQKCEGPTDFSDPFTAAPVTSTSQTTTYKNLHCAECNNADLESLRPFLYAFTCQKFDQELYNKSDEQFMDLLSYDQEKENWVLNRTDAAGNQDFEECGLTFYLPVDLHKSVRFCRANIISECAPDWNQPEVAKLCEEYMAVVYHLGKGYRNPHCAICNNKAISQLKCIGVRIYPSISFSRLIDLNYKSSPSCDSGQKYDPFAKKCRTLRCAFPGYVVIEDKCVPGE